MRINPDEIHIHDPEWLDVLYTRAPKVGLRHRSSACVSLEKQLDQNGIAEMRTNFTAWATDVISILAFPKPLHLLEDLQAAVDYHLSTKASMLLTPLQKQFPWLIETAWTLPQALVRVMSPDLARSVVLYRVRPKVFLITLKSRGQCSVVDVD